MIQSISVSTATLVFYNHHLVSELVLVLAVVAHHRVQPEKP